MCRFFDHPEYSVTLRAVLLFAVIEVSPARTAAGNDDEADKIKAGCTLADKPRDISNDTGVTCGTPLQVQLDDVTDLPDVSSTEAANISSIRY